MTIAVALPAASGPPICGRPMRAWRSTRGRTIRARTTRRRAFRLTGAANGAFCGQIALFNKESAKGPEAVAGRPKEQRGGRDPEGVNRNPVYGLPTQGMADPAFKGGQENLRRYRRRLSPTPRDEGQVHLVLGESESAPRTPRPAFTRAQSPSANEKVARAAHRGRLEAARPGRLHHVH